MAKFDYVVEVRDSSQQICQHRVPAEQISGRNLETLVKVLAAKHGRLEDDEVVAAFLNRNTNNYRPLLEINKHALGERFGWMCGTNPHVLVRSEPD